MIWATSSVNSHRRNALDSRPARPHRHGSFQTPTHPKHRAADGARQRTGNRPMRAQMSIEEQRRSGGIIDPDVVADTVIDLASDPVSAGRMIVVRAARHPYAIDPVDSDPSDDHRLPNVAVDLLRHRRRL